MPPPPPEADDNLPSITLVEPLALTADAVPDIYGDEEAQGCSTHPSLLYDLSTEDNQK